MADKPKVAESGVLRACLDLLAAERIWHRRWNTGAVKTAKRFFRFGQKGDADIQFTIPATWLDMKFQKVYWIETKSAVGRQTKEQREFQRSVEEQGHIYLLIRDISELQDWLKRNR